MTKAKIKVCCICKNEGTRYKCPTCKQPYCSVTCCKAHRKNGCIPEPEPINIESSSNVVVNYDFPTEDTVSIEKLEELRRSEEVKKCLENPHVRDIMKGILNSKNPTESIASAMVEPIFVELADACLKAVELPVNDKPC